MLQAPRSKEESHFVRTHALDFDKLQLIFELLFLQQILRRIFVISTENYKQHIIVAVLLFLLYSGDIKKLNQCKDLA